MDTLLMTHASWSILVIRVVLGVIFFAHGAQKVLGWFGGYGLKGTTQFLNSLGIPMPVAYLVCFFELLGGLGLIVGLLTRLAALAIVVVMIGAIAKVHWQHGFFLNWSLTPGKGHGYEANLALLAMAVACLLAGGGTWSLDALGSGFDF
jgi:putative oxidoreductase